MADEVLIVDDDARLAAMLSDYLGENGFGVSRAGTGLQGVEQIRRRQPDLVILDIMMSGVDGLSLCSQPRQGEAVFAARTGGAGTRAFAAAVAGASSPAASSRRRVWRATGAPPSSRVICSPIERRSTDSTNG